MELIKLRLPAPLASAWPSLLQREGFEIGSADASRARQVRCGRAEFQLTCTSVSDQTILDVSRIGDKRLRQHVERVLRASGAQFTVDALNDPSIDALYRCEPGAFSSAMTELKARGTPAIITKRPPLCAPDSGHSPTRYWIGTAGTPAECIRLETGPSCATSEMLETIFVAASPEYRFRASRGMRQLMQALHDSLQSQGATCVVRSILLDRPDI